MVLRNKNAKGFLCVMICAILVLGSFCGGDYVAALTGKAFAFISDLSSQTSHLAVNGSGKLYNRDYYNIEGYGGGAYVSSVVNETPTDIETLKEQACELYKNYKKSGDIEEKQMGATSRTLTYGVVEVDNKTSESISIKKMLNTAPSFGKITKDKPCILIYHTHSTEGYEMLDLGWFSNEYKSRTEDKSKNMIRVGTQLKETLEKAGFTVVHDTNIYDKSYNGAYDRSRVSVEKYLKKYPSIFITLDVHRDAIHYDNQTKCKPTAEINGKKAAQVMIISGCEGDGVKNFPRWEENLVFALGLQSSAQEQSEGLMRPVFFCNRKYNMDVTPCSLLLEFGTDANTLEEAVYSAELIGNALIRLLNER